MADWGATCGKVVMEGEILRRAHGLISFRRWRKYWCRVTYKAITITESQTERGVDPRKYYLVNEKLHVKLERYRVSEVLSASR